MKANKSKLKSHQKRHLKFQDYSNILNTFFFTNQDVKKNKQPCSKVKERKVK